MPGSVGETTITRATCGSRIAAIAHALPDLQRDPVIRGQAPRKQLKRLGPRLDAAPRAQPALRDDRDLAEVAMDIQRYRSHSILLVVDGWKKRWANDSDGSALAAQPGKSQGRPMKSPGSNTPIAQTACPACVLPKAPVPVDRT